MHLYMKSQSALMTCFSESLVQDLLTAWMRRLQTHDMLTPQHMEKYSKRSLGPKGSRSDGATVKPSVSCRVVPGFRAYKVHEVENDGSSLATGKYYSTLYVMMSQEKKQFNYISVKLPRCICLQVKGEKAKRHRFTTTSSAGASSKFLDTDLAMALALTLCYHGYSVSDRHIVKESRKS